MKWFLLIILFLLPGGGWAQTLAFPGAEGYGSHATGGRGGELKVVTTLADSGPGTLREAVEAEGARIIVFEVGGIIDLQSPLTISHPHITIAGQTAPEPGITLRGEQLAVQSHHVIVRYIRFRPGNYLPEEQTDWGSLDAVDIGKRDSDDVHDIIFDHCSFSWATDEVIGIWHTSRNITIQNSIISEPLHHFRRQPNPYPGQGLLIGSKANDISILRNLFAHNYKRHPYMNANGHLDFRNNIIYNAGGQVARFNNSTGITQTTNFVHNLIIPGPSSEYTHEVSIRRTSSGLFNGKLYIDGNISRQRKEASDNNWLMVIDEETGEIYPEEARSYHEFPNINTTTLPADSLYNRLIPHIGATRPARDQVDRRILADVDNRTGGLISQPNRVFGWPKYEKTVRVFDPGEEWQNAYDINLSDAEQANADYNDNGYTNIEEFLNGTNPLTDETGLQPPAESRYDTTTDSEALSALTTNDIPFEFHPNYPNPFSESTFFHFSIHEVGYYRLEVFDSAGRFITRLADSLLVAGSYELQWRPTGLPSGIYFVRLVSAREMITERITHIR